MRPSISGSYPSGHTTNATLAAIVMGDIVPEKRDAIWQRAADYSHSRVVGGMHYPNDLFGGKLAGTAIAVALQSRPEFKADFAAARRELGSIWARRPRACWDRWHPAGPSCSCSTDAPWSGALRQDYILPATMRAPSAQRWTSDGPS